VSEFVELFVYIFYFVPFGGCGGGVGSSEVAIEYGFFEVTDSVVYEGECFLNGQFSSYVGSTGGGVGFCVGLNFLRYRNV
jgi:hypothetical protein